ncbi:MAG: hypothetical protein K8R49_01710 [Candidatus Cloacimonetes bacterium]|nr:hypothetical protein [Candidatus Cloacimonadota bacterium]
MNEFKEELLRRRENRRKKRISTWTNLLIRILALIFVIAIIRYLGKSNVRKIERSNKTAQMDTIQVFEDKK